MQGTNAWQLVQPIVDVGIAAGLDRRALLRPANRVPIERVLDLWENCAHAANDVGLPMRVGGGIRLENLDLMGLAVLTSPTGYAALEHAIRYAPLVTDSGRWTIESGERVTIRWERAGERSLGHRLANEAGLVQFVACMRQLCGMRFVPERVQFRHAAPASVAAHRAYFRCPVEFGAADDSFWFRRAALDAIVPAAANPALASFVREHAEAKLAAFASLASRIRTVIERALRAGERPAIENAAHEVGASERTLRRHLAHAGTSWVRLLDDAIRDRAHVLVTQSEQPLIEIALALGFSDASAFSHAYRRWFGIAPRANRKR